MSDSAFESQMGSGCDNESAASSRVTRWERRTSNILAGLVMVVICTSAAGAAAQADAGSGSPNVSTDEPNERVSGHIGDAADTEMWDWTVELGMEVVLWLLALGAGALAYWRFEMWSDQAESFRDPAFEVEIDVATLREDGQLLDEVRGQIQAVGLHRLPSSSAGRYGGASMSVTYAAFVIDTNGETHDVAESADWAEVERDAEWLADEFDVPLKDQTY
jgi:hypothetical protein